MLTLLHNIVTISALKSPNKTAILFENNKWTFKEVDEKSNQIANYLQKIKLEKGDRVVIFLGNRVETIFAFWGILKAGAIPIPVGSKTTPENLRYILNDSKASVLFTRKSLIDKHEDSLSVKYLNKIIFSDNQESESPQENFYHLSEIFKQESKSPPKNQTISIDLASIIYTSGSTGEPKGVMLTHQNMVTATHSLSAYLQYQKEDKVLCAIPLSFDYGLYQMILCAFTGATLVLEKESTWPLFLLKKIAIEKISILPAVPTMIMLLHKQFLKLNIDLSSIRSVTNTGANLGRGNISYIKQMFPKSQIFSMYGLTECKRCTYLPPTDIDKKPDSIGIAIPNTELWLVNDQGKKITESGKIGQIVIRGGTIMKGYWNKPEKTNEKLKDGSYPNEKVLYTGDYGKLDNDGYLYFVGRIDQMIKSRGIKVSPKEVEDRINSLPEINATVVVGVPDENFGQVLFAFIELKVEESISKEYIFSFCKQNLEDYKIPKHFHLLPNLPKTQNGKFNMLELEQKALDLISIQTPG